MTATMPASAVRRRLREAAIPSRARVATAVSVTTRSRPRPTGRAGSPIPSCCGCTRRRPPRTAGCSWPDTRSTTSAAGDSPRRGEKLLDVFFKDLLARRRSRHCSRRSRGANPGVSVTRCAPQTASSTTCSTATASPCRTSLRRMGFWHRTSGSVAERYLDVRLRGADSCETAYAWSSVNRSGPLTDRRTAVPARRTRARRTPSRPRLHTGQALLVTVSETQAAALPLAALPPLPRSCSYSKTS